MAKTQKDFKNPTGLFISEPQQETAPAADEGYIVPEGYKLVRESKSARLQLLVTPTTRDNLKAVAITEGISLNELCNRIFEDFLKGAK